MIEVELDHFDYARPDDAILNLEKFQTLLKPLESLNGLKSAVVKDKVTEAYGAKLKKTMEGSPTTMRRRRKAETDNKDKGTELPKKKRRTKKTS